jgi:hypothetical protein
MLIHTGRLIRRKSDLSIHNKVILMHTDREILKTKTIKMDILTYQRNRERVLTGSFSLDSFVVGIFFRSGIIAQLFFMKFYHVLPVAE